jgi:hypothetical protein
MWLIKFRVATRCIKTGGWLVSEMQHNKFLFSLRQTKPPAHFVDTIPRDQIM